MILKTNIKGLKINFILRHKFEKKEGSNHLLRRTLWHTWSIGLWFKRNKVMGVKKTGKEIFDDDNFVNNYMFGIDFLIIKFWICITKNGLDLEI